MKFTHARSEVLARRFVNIIDGPEILHPTSSILGKKIILTKVEVYFVWTDGSWTVAGASSPNIYAEGWILNSDGRRTQRQWKGQIMTAPVRTEGAWLKRLIDGMRPDGVPLLPFDVTEA